MTSKKIHEVTKVDVHIHKSNPVRLHVTAIGTASSGSHTNPRLKRFIYVTFPADGIQEYDFLVDVPPGPVTDDVKDHTAEDQWESPSKELKGVRVYTETNSKEAHL